jgi:hypothetical protein
MLTNEEVMRLVQEKYFPTSDKNQKEYKEKNENNYIEITKQNTHKIKDRMYFVNGKWDLYDVTFHEWTVKSLFGEYIVKEAISDNFSKIYMQERW